MSLTVKEQVRYWLVAAATIAITLWFLGDVILPFVLGGAIAYLLDPIADRLEALGLSRAMSVATITVIALFFFVLVILLVIPTLVRQTSQLIDTAPELFLNLQTWLTEKFPSLIDEQSTIRQQLAATGEAIKSKGGDLLNSLLTSAMSLFNILILIIVVPVVTFYLLLDWDNMVARVDELLPRDHAPVVRKLAAEVDRTLASFIRGQGTVCLVLGAFYAIALMAVGLQFGLVAGAIAGALTFIPYVGALVGGALSIGLALFQFWGEWVWIAVVAGIFAIGQFLEGNVLTPKLVGSSIGLHPVWLIFALSVFGSTFGFVGMLVAVPVAAVLGVFTRFAITQYKTGRLYKGVSGNE